MLKPGCVTRRAVIVGSDGGPNNFLPGVTVDLASYRSFLISSAGGAWDLSEITVLKDRSAWELTWATQAEEVDFRLTVFSGHGHADQSGQTHVWINPHEHVPVSQLAGNGWGQMVIADSCRVVIPYQFQKRQASVGGDLGWIEDPVYRRSCRLLYDEAIIQSGGGASFAFSCEFGKQSADTRQGGVFSQFLLGIAGSWAEAAGAYSPWASQVLTLPSAVRGVHNALAQRRSSQSPALFNGRRRSSFPVAVG